MARSFTGGRMVWIVTILALALLVFVLSSNRRQEGAGAPGWESGSGSLYSGDCKRGIFKADDLDLTVEGLPKIKADKWASSACGGTILRYGKDDGGKDKCYRVKDKKWKAESCGDRSERPKPWMYFVDWKDQSIIDAVEGSKGDGGAPGYKKKTNRRFQNKDGRLGNYAMNGDKPYEGVNTVKACAEKCDKENGCQSFAFVRDAGENYRCFLRSCTPDVKNSNACFKKDKNVDTYYSRTRQASPCPCKSGGGGSTPEFADWDVDGGAYYLQDSVGSNYMGVHDNGGSQCNHTLVKYTDKQHGKWYVKHEGNGEYGISHEGYWSKSDKFPACKNNVLAADCQDKKASIKSQNGNARWKFVKQGNDIYKLKAKECDQYLVVHDKKNELSDNIEHGTKFKMFKA